MAVAFDAASTATGHTGAPTTGTLESWSHTCTGANGLLIVGVAIGIQSPDVDTLVNLTVTYNGVSMTDSGAGKIHSEAGTAGFVQVFYLVAPATGSNTVVVSSTGYAGGGFAFTATAGALSFTGADQVTPLRNMDGTTGNSASATNTVTGGSTSEMVFDFVGGGSSLTTHNQTTRWVSNVSGSSKCGNSGMATAAGSGSTVTMTRTLGSDSWANIAAAIQAAAAGGTAAIPYARRPRGLVYR